MGAYTETKTLADCTVGDRWVGISEITATINGETPGPNLERVVLTFRLGQAIYALDSDDGDIEITDADAWECSIAARDDFLPRAGLWNWEMAFYFGDDSCWTLYKGQIRVWDDLD